MNIYLVRRIDPFGVDDYEAAVVYATSVGEAKKYFRRIQGQESLDLKVNSPWDNWEPVDSKLEAIELAIDVERKTPTSEIVTGVINWEKETKK